MQPHNCKLQLRFLALSMEGCYHNSYMSQDGPKK
jgi:hypothetical protein